MALSKSGLLWARVDVSNELGRSEEAGNGPHFTPVCRASCAATAIVSISLSARRWSGDPRSRLGDLRRLNPSRQIRGIQTRSAVTMGSIGVNERLTQEGDVLFGANRPAIKGFEVRDTVGWRGLRILPVAGIEVLEK
jgi:hypothetical protein